MEIIPPSTHTSLFTSFYISHNKYYSCYYYVTDIDAINPVHSDSDSSELPDINVPGHYAGPPGKGLGQTSRLYNHAPHFTAHQKTTLVQLLHQQVKHTFRDKNKIL